MLDLFSGIGGFAIGLERAGMQTVAFCETEPFCQNVLKKHWPGVPIYDDVKTLTADRLARDGVAVDVICGGFPCQDISTAGKGAGLAGARSGLWFEFHRLIAELKPRYAIIENVAALRSKGLDQVLSSLAQIGYDAEWHCIPASAVGAPHRRDRIWIVAYPNGSMASDGRQRAHLEGEGTGGRDDRSGSDGHDRQVTLRGTGSDTSDVADSNGEGQRIQRTNYNKGAEMARPEEFEFSDVNGCSAALADSDRPRLEGRLRQSLSKRAGERIARQSSACQLSEVWRVEPNVGRVADGVPARTHRLKALGNAVVPQIPELLGRIIMALETTNPLPGETGG